MSDGTDGFATGIAHVVACAWVTRRLRRVTLRADEIAAMAPGSGPAPAVRLLLPAPGGEVALPTVSLDGLTYPEGVDAPTPRTFTLRRLDAATGSLDVDVVTGHSGPGSEWAAAAVPGDRVVVAGPKRFPPLPPAARHVLAGDESAVPAIATILETLDRTDPAEYVAVVEIEAPEDRVELRTDRMVHWVLRNGRPRGERAGAIVHEIVSTRSGPGEREATSVWLAGEAQMVRSLRRSLSMLDVPPEFIRACGYWRAEMSSTELDDGLLDARRRLMARGADLEALDEFALAVDLPPS